MATRPRRHIPHSFKLNWQIPVSRGTNTNDICVTTRATTITSNYSAPENPHAD